MAKDALVIVDRMRWQDSKKEDRDGTGTLRFVPMSLYEIVEAYRTLLRYLVLSYVSVYHLDKDIAFADTKISHSE